MQLFFILMLITEVRNIAHTRQISKSKLVAKGKVTAISVFN